jgi:hypothetical protein
MPSEQDLVDYMVWSSHAPQSVEALQPQVPRGVRWLAEMSVTESPLRSREPWWSYRSAVAHDLINLWLLQARPTRDRAGRPGNRLLTCDG